MGDLTALALTINNIKVLKGAICENCTPVKFIFNKQGAAYH